jgi:hypothetical protein
MESPSQLAPASLAPVLSFSLAVLALVSLLALSTLRRRSAAVGPLIARQGGAALGLRVALTVACVLGVGIALHWGELEIGPLVLATLLLATGTIALSPSERDACVGEAGVACGWTSRSFRELEEWRLTGEHLRWRVGPRWLACLVPVERHAALRERLAAACGDRESPFRA